MYQSYVNCFLLKTLKWNVRTSCFTRWYRTRLLTVFEMVTSLTIINNAKVTLINIVAFRFPGANPVDTCEVGDKQGDYKVFRIILIQFHPLVLGLWMRLNSVLGCRDLHGHLFSNHSNPSCRNVESHVQLVCKFIKIHN